MYDMALSKTPKSNLKYYFYEMTCIIKKNW